MKSRSQRRRLILAPELVINGGFDADSDWSQNGGSDYTIAGGVATHNGGASSNIYQFPSGPAIVAGNSYEISFDIVSAVDGGDGFQPRIGSVNGTYCYGFTTGFKRYTQVLTADSDGTSVQIRANTNCSGSIDNVSVRLVGS